MDIKTVIIGSGPSGLSAGYHLKHNYIVFEQNQDAGGLCRSKNLGEFIFDYAGHILFTRSSYVSKLFKKLLKDNLYKHRRHSSIYYKNIHTPYPFQANTFGLPKDVIMECIIGLVKAKYELKRKPKNFEEWIHSTFGQGIAKHFMIPYNKKVWAYSLKNIEHKWIAERVPEPKLEEVIEGAISCGRSDYGENAFFSYPKKGGCSSLVDAFLSYVKNIKLNCKVTKISLKDKILVVNNKDVIAYDNIITSQPLPELVSIIEDIPERIKRYASKLKWTSVICVNLGIDRENITDKHWIYYPEDKYVFQRIFVQSNVSPYVVPRGKSSVTCEISYSKYKYVDKKNIVARVVDDIKKTGMITANDKILVKDVIDMKYAYIIFDHQYNRHLKPIIEFLKKNDIYPCGRFGEWKYFNIDHSILSGKNAALEVIKKFG